LTISRRDVLTKDWIIEAMQHLDEAITDEQFDRWFYNGRIKIRGYLHNGRIVARRVREVDERLFSLKQVRELRSQSQANNPVP
jgi:hypothetical protein